MSLCATCQSADILNVPKLPKGLGFHAQNESPILVTIRTKNPQTGDNNLNTLGKTWHQTREELQASAAGCSICKVVEQDVSRFEAELKVAQENDYFRRRNLKGPDWQMWLARGENDVNGFAVISADTENKVWVWVLSTVGLCVEDDDALNSIVRGRKIEVDASSEITVQRASSWIQQSISDHDEYESSNVSSLPAYRVLDVGSTASETISLHTLVGDKVKYAALSDIRGMDQSTVVVSARKEHDECSITLNRLPQVYQDAVAMARELGLQYLWIGALCGAAEDLVDPSRGLADIRPIFSNAYVTISALGASSDQDSMLAQRSPPPYISFPHIQDNTPGTVFAFSLDKEATLYPEVDRILAHEPLSQQGWALQDRLFSPRILHFGTSQLYFECDTHFLSEDGFRMTGRPDTLNIETTSNATASSPSQANITWQRVLSLYRKRHLPKPTDTLPALSNIARHLAEQTGDTYLAGLWRSHLIDGLIWQATGHARGLTSEAPSYRAPSWSWASMTGPFGGFCRGQAPHDEGDWQDVAEVLDCQITLKGEDPYGEVTGGWVKLRAGLELLSPIDPAPRKQVWWMRTRNGSEKGSVCIFDTLARAERARNLEIYALVLTKSPRTCGEGKWSYHGIIVTPILGRESTYERLGKVVFSGEESLGECVWIEDKKNLVEVTLV